MTQEPKESWEEELPIVLRKFGYALIDWCEEKSPLEKVLEQENVVKQFITRLLNQERGRIRQEFIREFCNDHNGRVRWLRGRFVDEQDKIDSILALFNPKEQ